MIPTVLFIWFLLSSPVDKHICSLWVSKPPDNAALASACGSLDGREHMIWRAVKIQTGQTACEGPAADLPLINCNLAPLDQYVIQVIWPKQQQVVCAVTMTDSSLPGDDTIAEQCPDQASAYEAGLITLKYAGARPAPDGTPVCKIRPLTPGDGFYDLPSDPSKLQTAQPYALLAGNLIWHGLSTPACHGWSGLDPGTHSATACGIASTMPEVTRWQNQFDAAIYDAAVKTQVPPKLLKGVVAVESQFWPWSQGLKGETGMLQLTDFGADLTLLYSPDLYAYVCKPAIGAKNCREPYAILSKARRTAVRDTLRKLLTIEEAPLAAVYHVNNTMLIDASILSAYYCYAGEVTGTPSWDSTLAVYNAGAACVANGQTCQTGQDYIAQVTQSQAHPAAPSP